MKYQVLGHKRKLQSNDKPYEVVAEFNNLEQLYYMMDKVDRRKYNEVLVIDTYTNELVASRELEDTIVRRLKKMISFILGGLFGIIIMCIFQINK